jgi:hypothetical protein
VDRYVSQRQAGFPSRQLEQAFLGGKYIRYGGALQPTHSFRLPGFQSHFKARTPESADIFLYHVVNLPVVIHYERVGSTPRAI